MSRRETHFTKHVEGSGFKIGGRVDDGHLVGVELKAMSWFKYPQRNEPDDGYQSH
jgi:hypothetical protein